MKIMKQPMPLCHRWELDLHGFSLEVAYVASSYALLRRDRLPGSPKKERERETMLDAIDDLGKL